MSYCTWHNYGYGICTDQIEVDSVEKLEELLSYAPKHQNEYQAYFKECGISDPDVEDYFEFDRDCYYGLATILKKVIEEVEDIELFACDDFDCRDYLIYPYTYPWLITEKERDLTEEKLEQLFKKYVSILTDKPIDIDYQSVENGG